jgi:hypothetical protein
MFFYNLWHVMCTMIDWQGRFEGTYCLHVFYTITVRPTQPVLHSSALDCVWNVMVHAQKPDFFFRWNWRVHLNRRGRQFSGLLAAEVCVSAVVMLDTPCSEVVWRVLATHFIRPLPLHFPFRASPCAITFQLDCTYDAVLCCPQNKLALTLSLAKLR